MGRVFACCARAAGVAGALVLVALALLSINALFPPNTQPVPHSNVRAPVAWDRVELATRLADSLTFRTVSDESGETGTTRDIGGLHGFLRAQYPRVFAELDVRVVNTGALLITWRGSDVSLAPFVLAAHLDVVPVDEATEGEWTAAAFGGRASIDESFIYGRGAMDNKLNVLGHLEAITQLLEQGFAPRRTVVLAYGHDEEVSGLRGAAHLARALLDEYGRDGISFILDEGMVVLLPPALPGITRAVAVIGVAEKGSLTVRVTVNATGGHSSMPPDSTAIGKLARALTAVENTPLPSQLSPGTLFMFRTLCHAMPFPLRLALCNAHWLARPLAMVLDRDPVLRALIRTTTAVTMVSGGLAPNVLPPSASAVINHRIASHHTVATVLAADRDAVASAVPDALVEPLANSRSLEPAPVTEIDTSQYAHLARCIVDVFPHALVAPGLMLANTDTAHYWALTRNIFRFMPLPISMSDLSRIHGVNERVAMDDYVRLVDFYHNLVTRSATAGPGEL